MNEEDLKKIVEMSRKVSKNMSPNYRQRLVYNLLNALKAQSQPRFFDILLRAINRKDEECSELVELLSKAYLTPIEDFERWGYAVVLGIMFPQEDNV